MVSQCAAIIACRTVLHKGSGGRKATVEVAPWQGREQFVRVVRQYFPSGGWLPYVSSPLPSCHPSAILSSRGGPIGRFVPQYRSSG